MAPLLLCWLICLSPAAKRKGGKFIVHWSEGNNRSTNQRIEAPSIPITTQRQNAEPRIQVTFGALVGRHVERRDWLELLLTGLRPRVRT